MHLQILPIPRKPYALSRLPERLIVSHYEATGWVERRVCARSR